MEMQQARPSQSLCYEWVPNELKRLTRWVVWKLERRKDKSGKERLDKVPYSPANHGRASSTDSQTWASFEQAEAAYAGGQYQGIGFILCESDGLVFTDLDKCLNPTTGTPSEFAAEVLAQLQSYTEVSQSGTGLHIISWGTKPGDKCKESRLGFEMYTRARFCAMTGNVYANRDALKECGDGLRAVYARVWPHDATRQPKRQPKQPQTHHVEEADDEMVLARARKASNGAKFAQLWAGEWDEAGYPSQSEADAALCGMLCRACSGDEERLDSLFRQSGLMRDKWDERRGELTYGERTIAAVSASYAPPTSITPRQVQVLAHVHSWMASQETEDERAKKLRKAMNEVGKEIVRNGKPWAGDYLSVIALPPGAGKTHAIADLGRPTTQKPHGKHNIGLIIERKDQVEQVNFGGWHVREGCNATNCPGGWQLHQALAERGYNTAGVHKAHNCLYWQQLDQMGSTIYQIEHAGTPYLDAHDLYVIDEFNLDRWLPKRTLTPDTLMQAAKKFDESDEAYRLLEAMSCVVSHAREPMQGKPLFDTIDRACGGELTTIALNLQERERDMRERPFAATDDIEHLPPVVLPWLVRSLMNELGRWLAREGTDEDWNSSIRATWDKNGVMALCISERRPLPQGKVVLLDATADKEILRRLFGCHALMTHQTIEPMNGTRLIADKTSRYGKTALVIGDHHEYDQEKLARRVRWVLKSFGLEGRTAGLITHQGCEQPLAKMLDIPNHLHFWGQRGKNDLEHVDVLIVAGTPAKNAEAVKMMGRALYADDERPIDERHEKGRFVDERLQALSDYLTRAELTQAVNRSRVLRFANRTVILMSNVSVDGLEPTHEITQWCSLTDDGEVATNVRARAREERMKAATESLEARGENVTRRTLANEAQVSATAAAEYIRRWRGGKTD